MLHAIHHSTSSDSVRIKKRVIAVLAAGRARQSVLPDRCECFPVRFEPAFPCTHDPARHKRTPVYGVQPFGKAERTFKKRAAPCSARRRPAGTATDRKSVV